MKSILSPICIAMITFALAGCGALGGPGNADIVAVAKSQMMSNLGNDAADPKAKAAMEAAATAATVTPKGMCNKYEGEKYACSVDVTATLPGKTGPATTQMVVQIAKGVDGKWAAVE